MEKSRHTCHVDKISHMFIARIAVSSPLRRWPFFIKENGNHLRERGRQMNNILRLFTLFDPSTVVSNPP